MIRMPRSELGVKRKKDEIIEIYPKPAKLSNRALLAVKAPISDKYLRINSSQKATRFNPHSTVSIKSEAILFRRII